MYSTDLVPAAATKEQYVRKRDGKTLVLFDRNKIVEAINKALVSSGEAGEDHQKVAVFIGCKVVADLTCNRTIEDAIDNTPFEIEDIQDIVENHLMQSGLPKAAKKFIIYRKNRSDARELAETNLINFIEDYFKKAVWDIKENSNMDYSLQGLNNFVTSKVMNLYWMNKVYSPDAKAAHQRGDFHIHDASLLSVYTYSGSEVVIVKDPTGKIYSVSFQDLYHLLVKEEEVLRDKEINAYAKYPHGWLVLDKEGWTDLKRVVRKPKTRDMKFIKNRGGRSVIVTDNHPMITELGEKSAVDVVEKADSLYTVNLSRLLENENLFSIDEIDLMCEIKSDYQTALNSFGFGIEHAYMDGIRVLDQADTSDGQFIHTQSRSIRRKIQLTEAFGYAVGFIVGDGYTGYDRNQRISITSREIDDLLKVNEGLIQIGCPGVILRSDDTGYDDTMYELLVINPFLTYLMKTVFGIHDGSRNKTLPKNILQYNKEFVSGCLSGLIDSDGSVNSTSILIRTSSRTLLEQTAIVASFLGLFPRDTAPDGTGSKRIYKDRELIQRYPIYGLGFRKMSNVVLNSRKYNECPDSTKAWQDETTDAWHQVLVSQDTQIPDEWIYDLTTETSTLIVNGMWNHNCCGWSLEDLLSWGFGGVAGTNSSGPAKHFDAALGQIWNFLYSLQGEAAGAQALSNFDTYLAPFIRYDNLAYKEVKQYFQKFFHNMTTKTRVGFQAPFTNVSMDLYVPDHMKNEAVIIGGVRQETTYSEYQYEMDMINKAFCEVMIEGDYEGRQFSFPIPNYSITKDFDWDNPNLEPLWALTGKYGAPYFTNFVNSDLSPEDVRSMCPLHPDERIDIRMNGGYVSMRMEDVHKVLAYKTLHNVFVRLNDKEIPITGVTRHTSKGFVKIYTDLDPQGICMDHVHQQPYRLCMINHEGKLECTSVETVEAFFLPKQHCYVPYSKTNFKDFLPSEALDLDGMIWVPVRKIENVGLITQYSYCIAVDSADHLFEMGPGRLITHNCRLQLDKRELRKRGGGLFGANPLTGSVGVVTINLPKLGYKFKGDKETFFSELARLMDLAAESLQMKRMFIEKKCDEGLYPFSRYYMRHIKAAKGEYYYNHFSTIGVVGGNECIRNFWRGEDIDIRHPQGYAFMQEIQDFMRERMKMYQEKYGYPFNLEATPKSVGHFTVM